MHNEIYGLAALYFLLISVITSCITAADKIKAKKSKHRLSERTLFILAFLGGSVGEYITMKLIRHKTLHKRYMIGLPVIIFLQVSVIFNFILWQTGIIQNII